ncbi:Alpha/Beta hydrolase protein [Stachybotrys elegans]|uniref:Alpha/Beta hydrolase protein n=1 Tax=Stachybotrys elegans TaxID=80388 RepID=A0A8K0S927_9HYPO|nr:Alpha/Beta hydrolase protein [Stachybotrys elegans]
MLRTLAHIVSLFLRPTLDALWYGRHLPWTLRWRLLVFQPLSLLGNALITLPYLFRRPFTVDYIPAGSDRELRVLVFKHPRRLALEDNTRPGRPLRPLHVDCHSGGFVGGYPESAAPFCDHLARTTGAVVVSLSYRLAPVHPFPAAIDDVDAAIAWLQTNAASRFGADPTLMTVSGHSAGGNLALAATQAPACHAPADTAIKASVTFYAPVDMRPTPWEKPQSGDLPEWDPLSFMCPLFDSYAAPRKADMGESPRMNPIMAALETLPEKMLLVVPKADILVKEQLEFVERVKREIEDRGERKRSIETMWVEDQFHGYLEVPDIAVSKAKKMEAWDKGVDLIREVHREYGWKWNE